MFFKLGLIFIISYLISFLSTKWVIKFANKIGIVDDPKKNKHEKVTHTYPVPRGGGIAPFIAIVITSLIFLPFDKHLVGIISGCLILVIVGVLDDKYNINPYVRILTNILAACAPIAAGIGIAYITNPFGGVIDLSYPRLNFNLFEDTKSIWLLSDLFAIFWIFFIMNILNMGAKGIDGQLPGVVGISALVLALLSLKYSADITQWPIIILALITSGAFFGFLQWNKFPQKIMPGYSGSTIGGFMLAVLSILTTAKVGLLLVTLSLPIADTLYSIIRRISQGKSPVWGDRGHLHHRLLDYGLSKITVSKFYWFTTLILGIIALQLNTQSKLYTIVAVFTVILGVILWLKQKNETK